MKWVTESLLKYSLNQTAWKNFCINLSVYQENIKVPDFPISLNTESFLKDHAVEQAMYYLTALASHIFDILVSLLCLHHRIETFI